MVIDPFDHPFNGTVVSTRRFVAALAERGIQLRLLLIGGAPRTPAGDGVERVEFPELRLPLVQPLIDRMRAPLARPVRARLRQALAGCDVLHVQYPFFLGAQALTEARRLGMPCIASFHVQPENVLQNLGVNQRWLVPPLYWLFRRVFYDRADLVLAPSAYARRLLRTHGVRSPVAVLSNGIPQRFFEAGSSPPQREASEAAERFRVVSVGRLAAEKDQATLLHAIAASCFAERIDLQLHWNGTAAAQASTAGRAARPCGPHRPRQR